MIDEILVAAVSHTTKSPTEFLATLKGENGEYKPEAPDLIKQHFSAHLQNTVNEQSGRAVKARMKDAEKTIKPVADKYGIQWSDALEENLTNLVKKVEEQASASQANVEITDEVISKHPLFSRILSDKVKETSSESEKRFAALQKEYNDYKQAEETKRVNSVVRQKVEETLVELKAKLSDDPTKRQAQINTFVAGLLLHANFRLDEKDDPYPVDAKGEQLADKYMPVTFKEFVSAHNIFDTHAFDPRKGGAGASSQQQQSYSRNIQVPKNMAEFRSAMSEAKTPAERDAIEKAYTDYLESNK